jgi:alpha-D-xyloside xylohydrolase
MLTSHSRRHGAPPTEPWEYSKETLDVFRAAAEMRYRLMPYIYAQARDSAERGLPMLRALFIEYPEDPGAWLVDDQYLLGRDLLVAPLLEETRARAVYLPPGTWIDYQAHKTYDGGWHSIAAGTVPIVVLVREGAAIPHIDLAQSTDSMDWSSLDLVAYTAQSRRADALVCLPGNEALHPVALEKQENDFTLVANPLGPAPLLRPMHYTHRRPQLARP